MDIPIDLSVTRLPIKEKYIDEETPLLSRWGVFGTFSDGTVAICDGNGDDVFTHVPREMAKKLIEAREAFVYALLTTLNGTPASPEAVSAEGMREAAAALVEKVVLDDRSANGQWADHQRNMLLDSIAEDIRALPLTVDKEVTA